MLEDWTTTVSLRPRSSTTRSTTNSVIAGRPPQLPAAATPTSLFATAQLLEGPANACISAPARATPLVSGRRRRKCSLCDDTGLVNGPPGFWPRPACPRPRCPARAALEVQRHSNRLGPVGRLTRLRSGLDSLLSAL